MSFLRAEWRKLAFINYVIDPSVLQEFVPFGTELDFYENKCYISLVGLRFVNTRVLGFKISFHVNFEEVNLRFYVKRKVPDGWRRGVVFLKEIVPKPAITFVASTFYNEKYETMPMQHSWQENEVDREVKYRWKKSSKWQEIHIKAEKIASFIPVGSEAEFITEHYWGYAHVNQQQSNEYEVKHPKWVQYAIIDYKLEVDFALVYGAKFKFLTDYQPTSVMLAEGSEISVEKKLEIKINARAYAK
ncbi:hypothetical protein AHMF7605_04225 [Adhaeribacter arboris]|uniref:DUF2071 domain-containing protein n=1 Tax=Adhaeribacter arboris TaxID=2072846 RepID=A0A2T2YB96_9BACT|nr:DUF2071 domain-containing protein [Adhaeribacter arboris]PSR52785.1 hypothetical protein AHMF7605_04225 [Adhaeribacter arboris]